MAWRCRSRRARLRSDPRDRGRQAAAVDCQPRRARQHRVDCDRAGMNIGFRRPHGHRHRRGARLRPGDRHSLRRRAAHASSPATSTPTGCRNGRRRAARAAKRAHARCRRPRRRPGRRPRDREPRPGRSTFSSTTPAACAARSAGRWRRSRKRTGRRSSTSISPALFFMTQAVAPGMKTRGYGRIVNISSGAGLGISLTGIQAYASAKAGQIGLTRQLAHELGPFGITVNNVAPGFVRSNPTTERQWEAMGEDGQERLLQNIALKRLGSPDDIAHAVIFLRLRLCRLDHRPGPQRRRRQVSDVEAHLAANFDALCRCAEGVLRHPKRQHRPGLLESIRRAAEFAADLLRGPALRGSRSSRPAAIPWSSANGVTLPAPRPSSSTATTTCSRPTRSRNGPSPPFEPTVRNDRLYARGVSDDKGPLLIPILVAEAFLRLRKALPVNIKFLIEGEEEIGSPSFEGAVARLKDRLACDLVVSADGAMWRADLPSVTVASRGMSALDVTVTGAAKDLHSGRHGGSAPNPIRALAALLASLHDGEGNVVVAGFHDGVLPPDPAILDAIERSGFDAARYFDEIGAAHPNPLLRAATFWSANGWIRRWNSTASPAAIAGRARRPSSHLGRRRRSPAASSAGRTRPPSRPPSSAIAESGCRQATASTWCGTVRERQPSLSTRTFRRCGRSRQSLRRSPESSRCGSRWAQPFRSARCLTNSSACRPSSSASRPPTRTITLRTSSFDCGVFGTG